MDFNTGSLKINIFKVLFWEGGVTKKSTLCTVLIMLTIMDGHLPCHRSCGEEVDSLNECLDLLRAPRRPLAAGSTTLAAARSAPLRQLQVFLFLTLRFLVQNSHLRDRQIRRSDSSFKTRTCMANINVNSQSLQCITVERPQFSFQSRLLCYLSAKQVSAKIIIIGVNHQPLATSC